MCFWNTEQHLNFWISKQLWWLKRLIKAQYDCLNETNLTFTAWTKIPLNVNLWRNIAHTNVVYQFSSWSILQIILEIKQIYTYNCLGTAIAVLWSQILVTMVIYPLGKLACANCVGIYPIMAQNCKTLILDSMWKWLLTPNCKISNPKAGHMVNVALDVPSWWCRY